MNPSELQRDSDGKLPAYAWPGGYVIIYLDGDNCTLCADCATKSLDDPDEAPNLKPWYCSIEQDKDEPPDYCEQCGKELT